MLVQDRDFIATDVINPRVESFRDKFRLHEIHPARAKTVSFRVTVLLFAVSVPFQPRPARFERNEESDGPLDRRRGRRRPRKLVVSIRVWGAAKNIRLSLVRPFFYRLYRSSKNRWNVEANDTGDCQCGYHSIVSGIVSYRFELTMIYFGVLSRERVRLFLIFLISCVGIDFIFFDSFCCIFNDLIVRWSS